MEFARSVEKNSQFTPFGWIRLGWLVYLAGTRSRFISFISQLWHKKMNKN